MIQRVQSIYLLLASLVGIVAYFVPLAITPTEKMLICNLSEISGQVATASIFPWLSGVAIALSTLAIFVFKKRKLQIKIASAAALLYVATVGLFLILADRYTNESIKFQFGVALPLLSAVFCYLAIRGINNDEKLVRAADRLR
jgi:hypothetical protein